MKKRPLGYHGYWFGFTQPGLLSCACWMLDSMCPFTYRINDLRSINIYPSQINHNCWIRNSRETGQWIPNYQRENLQNLCNMGPSPWPYPHNVWGDMVSLRGISKMDNRTKARDKGSIHLVLLLLKTAMNLSTKPLNGKKSKARQGKGKYISRKPNKRQWLCDAQVKGS